MKTYVTFGPSHAHSINGKTFDKDCVAIVDGDRDKVIELFGQKFCSDYPEQDWDDEQMKCFPRGYIKLKRNDYRRHKMDDPISKEENMKSENESDISAQMTSIQKQLADALKKQQQSIREFSSLLERLRYRG